MDQQANIYVYLYQTCKEDAFSLLPKHIQDHILACHTHAPTQKMSASNYFYLGKKLQEMFHCSLNEIYFRHQKPCIRGIYLSLSHSSHGYGFALSAVQNIGFDIETIRPIAHRNAFAKHILNDEEKKRYEQEDHQDTFLFQCWCKKEAYGKMKGKGITKKIWKEKIVQSETQFWKDQIFALVSDQRIENVLYFYEEEQPKNQSKEIGKTSCNSCEKTYNKKE